MTLLDIQEVLFGGLLSGFNNNVLIQCGYIHNQPFGTGIMFPITFSRIARVVATPITVAQAYICFQIIDVQGAYFSCVWHGTGGATYDGDCMYIAVGY